SSSDSLSRPLSSVTVDFLSGLTTYRALKSLSTSTPRRAHFSPLYLAGTSAAPRGRSRMWPREDSTMYPEPRYDPMVRALAGDSTITRRRPVPPGEPFFALATCSRTFLHRRRRHPAARSAPAAHRRGYGTTRGHRPEHRLAHHPQA